MALPTAIVSGRTKRAPVTYGGENLSRIRLRSRINGDLVQVPVQTFSGHLDRSCELLGSLTDAPESMVACLRHPLSRSDPEWRFYRTRGPKPGVHMLLPENV